MDVILDSSSPKSNSKRSEFLLVAPFIVSVLFINYDYGCVIPNFSFDLQTPTNVCSSSKVRFVSRSGTEV